MSDISIRIATPDDAEALLAIYAPYVEKTAITFELTVPSLKEFKERIVNTLREYPYLVAEAEGRIVGYCYASAFHSRAAYKHTVETSIYVDMGEHGHGIGKALYAKLEELLLKQNVYILYACSTYTDREDEFLPKTAPQFHVHIGYERIGVHENCGYKFDRWYSIVWLEKAIAERPKHPEPFVPFMG